MSLGYLFPVVGNVAELERKGLFCGHNNCSNVDGDHEEIVKC